MLRHSFSPLTLIIFLILLGFLLGIVHFGLVTVTFSKLGLSTNLGILLFLTSLLTSLINIPIIAIKSTTPLEQDKRLPAFLLHRVPAQFEDKTIIAVNVGGCLIPVLFCCYLFIYATPLFIPTLLCTSLVAMVSYLYSRPIMGIGIGMPMLIAPATAAIFAIIFAGEDRAAVAYIAGTLGVLIGADLLRLKNVRELGAPLASIGGAGTYDGIFITGLLAALLT